MITVFCIGRISAQDNNGDRSITISDGVFEREDLIDTNGDSVIPWESKKLVNDSIYF